MWIPWQEHRGFFVSPNPFDDELRRRGSLPLLFIRFKTQLNLNLNPLKFQARAGHGSFIPNGTSQVLGVFPTTENQRVRTTAQETFIVKPPKEKVTTTHSNKQQHHHHAGKEGYGNDEHAGFGRAAPCIALAVGDCD